MIKQIQGKVIKALQEAKIDFILYGSTVITDRETNDVDLIIKLKDWDRVDGVMEKIGYHKPIPFIFEKKFQNGTRYNVEVKYDLHPKITETLKELWKNTITNNGIRVFTPAFHALILYLHTDRHIKEGLFDKIRIEDLKKIKVGYDKVYRMAKKYEAVEPVKRIIHLLEGRPYGYGREELFYPSKKRLFEDKRTIELLGRLLPPDIPDEWDKGLRVVKTYRNNRIKEYKDFIRKPDYRIAWEVGYPKHGASWMKLEKV